MRIKAGRATIVPVAPLAILGGLASPALAHEEDPLPVPPPAVVSEEAAAADDSFESLPEVSDDGDPVSQACDNPYKKWTEITSKKATHVPAGWGGASYKDGPGGTMVVKMEKGGKLKAEISAGLEAELDAVIAKAKTKFDATIGAEVSLTAGHEYRRPITRGKYGHVQYGSWGYDVKWAKYETGADRCGKKLLKRGTAKLPTKEVGWKYWETSS